MTGLFCDIGSPKFESTFRLPDPSEDGVHIRRRRVLVGRVCVHQREQRARAREPEVADLEYAAAAHEDVGRLRTR